MIARAGQPHRPQQFLRPAQGQPITKAASDNAGISLGLASSIARSAMVARLRRAGIADETVLRAINCIPRHMFVDSALASWAYEDTALPIGYQQTISQPWVVAHMITLARGASQSLMRCLEIGTGCGYQAAVLSLCAAQVCSIERIEGLHTKAGRHLADLQSLGVIPANIQLLHHDGKLGWPDQNLPGFDAIVVAAGGVDIPPAWLAQLRVGGRLVAPVADAQGVQQLHLITRISAKEWQCSLHDTVQFVPLLVGLA